MSVYLFKRSGHYLERANLTTQYCTLVPLRLLLKSKNRDHPNGDMFHYEAIACIVLLELKEKLPRLNGQYHLGKPQVCFRFGCMYLYTCASNRSLLYALNLVALQRCAVVSSPAVIGLPQLTNKLGKCLIRFIY